MDCIYETITGRYAGEAQALARIMQLEAEIEAEDVARTADIAEDALATGRSIQEVEAERGARLRPEKRKGKITRHLEREMATALNELSWEEADGREEAEALHALHKAPDQL